MADNSPSKAAADLVDVHILDIAAHLEAVLRRVRELQRDLLRVRGVPLDGGDMPPADSARGRLNEMLQDCAGLRGAVDAAIVSAQAL